MEFKNRSFRFLLGLFSVGLLSPLLTSCGSNNNPQSSPYGSYGTTSGSGGSMDSDGDYDNNGYPDTDRDGI